MRGQTPRRSLVIVLRIEARAVVREARPVTMVTPGGQTRHIARHVRGVHSKGEAVIAVHGA